MNDSTEHLIKLRERAEKAVALYELMNKTFTAYPEQNLITIFMACIEDGYRQGIRDALKK